MTTIEDTADAYVVKRNGVVIACTVPSGGGEWLGAALIYGCMIMRHRTRDEAVAEIKRTLVLEH